MLMQIVQLKMALLLWVYSLIVTNSPRVFKLVITPGVRFSKPVQTLLVRIIVVE